MEKEGWVLYAAAHTPTEPTSCRRPRLIGSGRVFVPFLANQSGNFGVVLGRGGIYLVGVEDEEDLFDGVAIKLEEEEMTQNL